MLSCKTSQNITRCHLVLQAKTSQDAILCYKPKHHKMPSCATSQNITRCHLVLQAKTSQDAILCYKPKHHKMPSCATSQNITRCHLVLQAKTSQDAILCYKPKHHKMPSCATSQNITRCHLVLQAKTSQDAILCYKPKHHKMPSCATSQNITRCHLVLQAKTSQDAILCYIAPFPLLPMPHQSGLDRVVENIGDCALPLIRISHVVVVTLVFPEFSATAKHLVALSRAAPFDPVHDRGQGVIFHFDKTARAFWQSFEITDISLAITAQADIRRDFDSWSGHQHHVQMIGHNAKGIEPIMIPVLIMDGLRKYGRDAIVGQPARAGFRLVQ